ncbi:uncharacterized protein LOC143359084 isoform X3 [Halictus rubicundus]|uniref:uncharacterized protein LOC143359084 isoform X3 n=1 Tax=Halictus rubicundus TaxID=77578 RepID=UPI004037131C
MLEFSVQHAEVALSTASEDVGDGIRGHENDTESLQLLSHLGEWSFINTLRRARVLVKNRDEIMSEESRFTRDASRSSRGQRLHDMRRADCYGVSRRCYRPTSCNYQQAAEKGGSFECCAPGADRRADGDDADLDDRRVLVFCRGMLHADVDHDDIHGSGEHARRTGQRVRGERNRGTIRMAVSTALSTASLTGAVRVVQRPGYSCARTAVGQAWIREGNPQKHRGALASPG